MEKGYGLGTIIVVSLIVAVIVSVATVAIMNSAGVQLGPFTEVKTATKARACDLDKTCQVNGISTRKGSLQDLILFPDSGKIIAKANILSLVGDGAYEAGLGLSPIGIGLYDIIPAEGMATTASPFLGFRGDGALTLEATKVIINKLSGLTSAYVCVNTEGALYRSTTPCK